MSAPGKLDQSLDDILKTRRGGGRTRGRLSTRRATKVAIPVIGGVTKSTRGGPRQNTRAAPVPTVPATGNSKIIVSGLPTDVTEVQIKEYFGKTIGPVRSVFLVYGPNGTSRGQATILFTLPTSAHEAASKLNGVKVDNRSMKIEVVLGAKQAPVPVIKALGERIVQTNQPKSAAAAKSQPKTAATTNGRRGAAKPARGGRGDTKGRGTGRPKRKTAEELDAEMTDYFVPKEAETNGAVVNGNTAPATAGDASMDDQIM